MKNTSIKLIAVGDIFLADSPLKIGRGVRSSIDKNGKEYFINKIIKILDGYDCCFGNVECVLSDINYNKFNVTSVEIRGKTDYADIISKSGFNIVNIANNHIFQHGFEPYADTVNNLVRRGVKVIGDEYFGRNFEVFEHNNIQIGFIGYSLHYEQYHPNDNIPYCLKENINELLLDIKKVRTTFDGVLICSLHWGHEFLDLVSLEQQELCHMLIDYGVDIILGHHSHVAQGIEEYNGSLIVYSLGNFVFDMDIETTKSSYALEISIDKNGFKDFKIRPITIGSDCCPAVMDTIQGDNFVHNINQLSKGISNGNCLTDKELFVLERNISRRIYNHGYKMFFKNIFKTNLYYNAQLIFRAIMRRIGLIRNP